MSKFFCLPVLFLATFLASPAFAADIFVDGSLAGNCAGTYSIAGRNCFGTDGYAFVKPQSAADIVNPGDTVYFREGTYYNHESASNFAVVMKILRSGTADNPITFKNYDNEEVILSAMYPGEEYHYRAVTLGIQPSDLRDLSGQGVQNIIIDGLIVEGGYRTGLAIFGPADRYGPAENPTENVIVRNVIARNNVGDPSISGNSSSGISTQGRLVNVLIEYCEAYGNAGTGIAFGDLWALNPSEPEDEMSTAQYSTIRNCLSYNNINAPRPGGADGIVGSHTYRCTFEDNVCFNNDDDGLDILASIEATAKDNISFNHNYPGGNNCGFKFSALGGGRHTVAGNIALNNVGFSFEWSDPYSWRRTYYPSRIYGNLAYNGYWGFSLGSTYDLSYPGFEKVYLRDNLGLENGGHDIRNALASYADSNYNFFSNPTDLATMQSRGLDLNSLTGDAGLVNKNAVIDTNFDADWNTEQKLEYIRSQVRAAFSLAPGSQLIDAGVVVPGYHCETAGEHPGEDCKEWFGLAPDIGALEFEGSACITTKALLGYIGQWKQGSLSMPSLISRIASWKAGIGC